MKNKVTLTITANEYKLKVTLDGQSYGRRMKKQRDGVYSEQANDCPDYEMMDEIDESFPDELDSLMMSAGDIADLLSDFEEMDD